MKNIWKILILLIVNVIVSVSATFAVLYYWENIRNAEKPYTLITSEDQQSTNSVEATLEIDFEIVATEVIPTDSSQDAEENPAVIPPIRDNLVKISQVFGTGDVNSEAIRIESNSDLVVVLENWTLEDSEGKIYTFPNIQLMKQWLFIELYSRSGHDSPYELYWGQAEPVWQSGETVVLKDADGNVQSTFRIP